MAPNIAMAREFLKRLFPDEGRQCFQWIPVQGKSNISPGWMYGDFDEMADLLTEKNVKEFCGIYFMVNEGDGQGREAKNITKVRSFFVDLDEVDPTAKNRRICEPHILTETSRGRYQAFWRVKDCPLDKFTAVQRALAVKFHGDHAVVDLPRIMRLPGFYNRKRGNFQCVVARFKDQLPDYEWEDFVKREGLDLDAPVPSILPENNSKEVERIPEGQRHEAIVQLGYRLRWIGTPAALVAGTLRSLNHKMCDPPLPDSETDRIARDAVKGVTPSPLKKGGMKIPFTESKPPAIDTPHIQSVSFSELSSQNLPELAWIVQEILPAGLCMLVGRPKVRKSWLTQALCFDVATGQQVMGYWPCTPQETMCIALEDSPNRFMQRLNIISHGNPKTSLAHFSNVINPKYSPLEQLYKTLDVHPGLKLIVIDTWAKFKQGSIQTRGNAYFQEYDELAQFQQFAIQQNIAVVMIHHEKKGSTSKEFSEAASGTAAMGGVTDTHWLLRRDWDESDEGVFTVDGRDVEAQKIALKFDTETCRWNYEGKTWQRESLKTQDAIIEYLNDQDVPRSPKDIATELSKPQHVVRAQLYRMTDQGLVEKMTRGRYQTIIQHTERA